MNSLFSRLFARKPQVGRPARGFRPRLEGLEDRMVLSATVGLADAGHTVVITGDASANQISIIQDDANNQIHIIADGVTHTYLSSQITKLTMDLKEGDDTLSWKLANGSGYSYGKTADIKLGDGNDTAAFDLGVGPLQGHWLQSSLAISVEAGIGDDEVNANFGHKHGGTLDFTAYMGEGDDEVYARLWSDVTGGADVTFNLFGQKGNDIVNVWNTYDQDESAYGAIAVSKNSTLTLNLGGGEGNDKIYATYAGEMDGKLTMNAHGDKGNDLLEADILLTISSSGIVDLALMGNDDNDWLSFRLKNNAGAGVTVTKAVLDGGAGYDRWNWQKTTANVTKTNVEGTYPFIIVV